MSAATHSRTVLVLGTQASGKSTFAAQLLGRIQRVGESRLRARVAPGSLRPYEAALERVEEGRAPEHTELALFAETPLPLLHHRAGAVDLVWPEYAGETIQRMVAARQVPQHWFDRLKASDVWLLFVRLSDTFLPQDVISRRILPAAEPATGVVVDSGGSPAAELSRQAMLIELLQIFVHLRGLSTTTAVRRPVLGVLLSCFDEVQAREDRRAPIMAFREKLPLLAAFVESVWSSDSCVVLGLSSSGQPLLPDKPNRDFVRQGAERQGYIVLPDGKDDADLTLAVSLPLELLYE
jgi:hypothetical protein